MNFYCLFLLFYFITLSCCYQSGGSQFGEKPCSFWKKAYKHIKFICSKNDLIIRCQSPAQCDPYISSCQEGGLPPPSCIEGVCTCGVPPYITKPAKTCQTAKECPCPSTQNAECSSNKCRCWDKKKCTQLNPNCPPGEICSEKYRVCMPPEKCANFGGICSDTRPCCYDSGTKCHLRSGAQQKTCQYKAFTGEDCTQLRCEDEHDCINGKCSLGIGDSCDHGSVCPQGFRCMDVPINTGHDKECSK